MDSTCLTNDFDKTLNLLERKKKWIEVLLNMFLVKKYCITCLLPFSFLHYSEIIPNPYPYSHSITTLFLYYWHIHTNTHVHVQIYTHISFIYIIYIMYILQSPFYHLLYMVLGLAHCTGHPIRKLITGRKWFLFPQQSLVTDSDGETP